MCGAQALRRVLLFISFFLSSDHVFSFLFFSGGLSLKKGNLQDYKLWGIAWDSVHMCLFEKADEVPVLLASALTLPTALTLVGHSSD